MSEVSTVESLERQLADASEVLARRTLAIRLSQNPDFRKLILEGFCLNDAARYVQESADPFLTAEQRQDALNLAQASGHLKRYLSLCIQMGAHVERTLPEIEDALSEARAEEDLV